MVASKMEEMLPTKPSIEVSFVVFRDRTKTVETSSGCESNECDLKAMLNEVECDVKLCCMVLVAQKEHPLLKP